MDRLVDPPDQFSRREPSEFPDKLYLCEQAAEKLIRAVLTSEGIQGGTRHELPDMVAKIPDANPMKSLLLAIEHLDAYATAYRYPSPRGRVKPAPTPAEIDQDIVKIDAALVQIAARFAIDLSKVDGLHASRIRSAEAPNTEPKNKDFGAGEGIRRIEAVRPRRLDPTASVEEPILATNANGHNGHST